MNKNDKNIDSLFRGKLADHQEQPSPLVWEKIEKRLSKQSRPLWAWWRIAASFLLLMGFITLLWINSPSDEAERNTLTLKQEVPEVPKKDAQEHKPVQEALIALDKEEKISMVPEKRPDSNPSKGVPMGESESESMARERENRKEVPLVVEVADMEPPPMDMDLLTLKKDLKEQEKTEVDYTVKIISNGISYQPEKETFVEEMGDKIAQIGGMIDKVDQRLAALQDAKNGLFASLTAPKDPNKN